MKWIKHTSTSFDSSARDSHQSRMAALISAAITPRRGDDCYAHVDRWKWDVYQSSSPMLWVVMRLKPHTEDDIKRWRREKVLAKRGGYPSPCVVRTEEFDNLLAEKGMA
jgi:hypothetical protein